MFRKRYRYLCMVAICLFSGFLFPKTSGAEEVSYTKVEGMNWVGIESIIGYDDSQGLAYRFGTGYENPEEEEIVNPYHMEKGELRVLATKEVGENVIIPDEVDGHKVVGVARYGFENCSQIKSIQFGKNIRTIERAAFRGCSKLESVRLENGVQTIGAEAFKDCTSLAELTFQGSIEEWGYHIFEGTPLCNAARAQGKPLILNRALVDGKAVKGNIAIKGSKVDVIAENAFYNNKKIKKVKISGVKQISSNAFASSSVTDLTITGAKKMGEYAFLNCNKLKKAKVSGMKTVPRGMFYGCSKMTSVAFGKAIQKFEKSCLKDCSRLKTIRILSKKKVIFQGRPLLGCGKLRHVYMRSTELSKTLKKALKVGNAAEKKLTLHVPKSKKKSYRKYTKGKVVAWK